MKRALLLWGVLLAISSYGKVNGDGTNQNFSVGNCGCTDCRQKNRGLDGFCNGLGIPNQKLGIAANVTGTPKPGSANMATEAR